MARPSLTVVLLSAVVMAALFYPHLPSVRAADASPPPGPNCDYAINSLVACYNFVTGAAILPSEECCAAFATVQREQPVCLCELLSSDSGGGGGLNVTLASEIPSLCKVTGVDASNCAGLASPSSPRTDAIPAASPGAAEAVGPSTESALPRTGSGSGNAAYSSRSVPATSIWFAIAGLGSVAISLIQT